MVHTLCTNDVKVLALPTDITDATACQRAVDAALTQWGAIDLLFNNAEISHRSLLAQTDVAVIWRVMGVNFFGAMNLTQAALPHLLARRGAIVAVSSVAGLSEDDIAYIAITGEGENVKFATGHFYSMTTHARGGDYLDPLARAVVDIGALNGRAIYVDERSTMLSYKMTSQCASGSGQFLENIARYLGVAVEAIGRLSQSSSDPEKSIRSTPVPSARPCGVRSGMPDCRTWKQRRQLSYKEIRHRFTHQRRLHRVRRLRAGVSE